MTENGSINANVLALNMVFISVFVSRPWEPVVLCINNFKSNYPVQTHMRFMLCVARSRRSRDSRLFPGD